MKILNKIDTNKKIFIVDKLVREKVGNKICENCKIDILKTQWRYNLIDFYAEDNTKSYIHQDCLKNYIIQIFGKK